jgi:hypothetical protein
MYGLWCCLNDIVSMMFSKPICSTQFTCAKIGGAKVEAGNRQGKRCVGHEVRNSIIPAHRS